MHRIPYIMKSSTLNLQDNQQTLSYSFMVKIIVLTLEFLLWLTSQQTYGQNFIVVSKENMKLSVINKDMDTLYSAPISIGSHYGNKTKEGDRKTPEGVF